MHRLPEEYAANERDYVKDFEAQFPRKVDEQELLMAISDYLKLAQELVDLLEKVFPSASGERESGR